MRPGKLQFEESYAIPNTEEFKHFWEMVYTALSSMKIYSPVRRKIETYINPYFGYFGYRVHPVTQEVRYFHGGISLELKHGRKITPILPGVLEYSGYGATNGYYVLLSHPDIRTEDGYILHSMYCHLKKPQVRFNSYQKMLREISLGSYPEIPVPVDRVLGTASTTGLSREHHPGLYLQISLRKFNEKPIVIDPLRLYSMSSKENITHDLVNPDDIQKLFSKKKNTKR